MDIDKLFLSSIQYRVSREKDGDKFHQTVSDKFEEKEDAYYQNKLIRDYIALLLDKESVNTLHRSIDNDTKLLKDIIKDLESNVSKQKEEPYGFYSLSAQTEAKNDYITGKIGIGPYALNNNNHVLTMMYHVRFKHIESSIMSALGLESLDNRTDKDGESIMSWLSALINAHVDIAKDPYISRLNVNPFTYNLTNLLVRTGLGKKTFYFTTQPIMKDLAEAYINAGSMYMADPYSSKYTLQQEAIDEVADDWFGDMDFKFEGYDVKSLINAIKEGGIKNKDIRTKVNEKIKDLFDKSLRNDAKSEQVNKENQLFYYLAYLQFDKYANALSSLVTYSKIDTKKHGKSVIEQIVYDAGFTRTYDIDRDDNLFDPESLSHMLQDSYIYSKTRNAIDSVRDILSSQFIESTPVFLNAIDSMLKAIGRSNSLSVNLVNKVADALSASIKSQFFVDEYVPTISNNPHFIHDLISESKEIVDFKATTDGYIVYTSGDMFHKLQSYVGGVVQLWIKGQNGQYSLYKTPNNRPIKVLQVDEGSGAILISSKIPVSSGRIVLNGGKNTIWDRLMKLQTSIRSNPEYRNLLNSAGEVENRVLQMLISGKLTEYVSNYINGEQEDTYTPMKFVKFFNFVEDSGNTANYLIDGWEELLEYTDENKDIQEEVRSFARDLIVYGFVTSGDKGGFTKIFKYVPASWREESGYGQFIYDKLVQYSMGLNSDIDIADIILNNWFDNEFVRTYKLQDPKTKKSNFVKYTTKIGGVPLGFPTMLAAITKEDDKYVASIDPKSAPMFIKIKRRKDRNSYDSQRRFTIYKLHKIAISNEGVEYPVYIKVNAKGNKVSDGFLITEYGRSDSVVPQEYSVNEQTLENAYKATDLGQQIQLLSRTEPEYSSIMSGLNRAWREELDMEGVDTALSEEQANVEDSSTENNKYDDSDFSDEAMKHCKS